MQRRYLAVAIGSAILGLACQDALSPRPPELRPPTKLSRTMQALAPVSATLPVTGGSKVLIVNWPYREGVQVARTYSGLTSIASDPRNAPLIRFYTGDVDYKGIHVDGVWQFCAISASIRSRGTDAPGAGACPATDPSQISSYTDTAIVGDSVFAVRSAAVPEYPGDCTPNPSCYAYSGSTSLTLTPLPADLDLRGGANGKVGKALYVPTFTHQNGYANIMFTDSALPRERPFQALSWSWHKIDPSAPPDSYWGSTDVNGQCPTRSLPLYTSNLCSLNVKEAGWLVSVVRVNGLPHTDSVSVECAEDSLLDNPNIRADLVAALQASDNADPQLRRERGGWIMQDTLTKAYFSVPDTVAIANATDCNITPTNMVVPGAWQVGYYHTHPHQAPDSAWSCLDPVTHQPYGHKVMVNPKLGGGGSPSDWSMATQGWPQYIISLHGEDFKLPETSGNWTQAQKDANPNRWWWKKGHGLCTWAAAANL